MSRQDVRIRAVKYAAYRVPLAEPLAAAAYTFHAREYLACELECEDGSSGLGLAYVGTGGAVPTAIAGNGLVAAMVEGRAADPISVIRGELEREFALYGRSGLLAYAVSALDIALWDRLSRSAGRSLVEQLGVTDLDTVSAYASGGYYRSDSSQFNELQDEIAGYVDAGFDAIKIKVGRLPIAKEHERLSIAREAMGNDRILMIDAYGAWDSLPDALRYIGMCREFNPYWIEDPFPPDNLEMLSKLCRTTDLPVAAGEFCFSRADFLGLINAGVTILQPEAPRCGGVTGYLDVARLAESYGRSVAPVWFHPLHASLLPATQNGLFVECFVGPSIFNLEALVDVEHSLVNGNVSLADSPGLGFELRDDSKQHLVVGVSDRR